MTHYRSSAFWQTTDKQAARSSEKIVKKEFTSEQKAVVISILSVYSQMMTYKAVKASCHEVNMDYHTLTLKIYVILHAI